MLGEQPPCDAAITICVEAWHDLSTCRALGYGVMGMIPWTAIVQWAGFHQLDADNTALLITVIQRLDGQRAEREASKARNRGETK